MNSLSYELNEQGQFLNERGLDAFSTICTKICDKRAPCFLKNRGKKIESYLQTTKQVRFTFAKL